MATPTGYTNPLLAAVYERYGIMDDTAATTDKNALAAYTALEKELAKYRSGGINAQVLKQWADGLKAETASLASTQRAITTFNETAAKSDRVQTEAIAKLRANVNDNFTKLATQAAQITSTRVNPAIQAYTAAGGNIAAGMESLTQTLSAAGPRVDMASPDMAAMMQEVSTRMFGKPLDQITADEAASMVGPNQFLQQRTRELFLQGQSALSAQRLVEREVADVNSRLEELTQTSGGVLTGAQRQEAIQLADKLGTLIQTQVGMSPEELRIEMERVASLDSTYRKLEQDTEEMRALAIQPGQEGLRSKIGRVVATDEFRAWAEDNGFNIGQAQIDANGEVIYVPGQDDERALLAYGRQMKTGAPVRLFGTQNTGKRVRVTATDPEERARLLQQNDLGGGQYAVLDGTVVSPAMYRRELRASGLIDNGLMAASANGTTYIKNGADVLKYADGKFVPLAEGEAAPTDFKPAMVYVDGKGRYMTAADIDNPPKDPNDIGFVTPEDKREIDASSPFKIVTADQVPSLGEVTFDGYLDKANAQLIAKHGTGALSINNGQHVFTKGAKVEVLETRGAGEPLTTSLERRAKRREAGAEFKAMTPEQVRTAAAQERKTSPAAAPVGVSDIAARAAADEAGFGPARVETLVEGGIISPREGAAALEAAEAAPVAAAPAAAAPARFRDDAGFTFEVVDDNTIKVVGAPAGTPMPAKTEFKRGERAFEDVVKKLGAVGTRVTEAPAVPAAPAAPKARYAETPDGAQYRIDREGVTMVTPPRGETMPAQPKTMPFGSDEADAVTARSDLRVLPPAAAQAIETRMAGLGKEAVPPEAEVTERRGSTFIDRGVRRTVGGDIREALAKAGGVVGGVFKRRPPTAEGEMIPPGEAAPPDEAARADRERRGLPPIKFPAFKRREQMERQAAIAGLPAADETLPESTGVAGPAVSLAPTDVGQAYIQPRVGKVPAPTVGQLEFMPPEARERFAPDVAPSTKALEAAGLPAKTGTVQMPTDVASALEIGRGRQAMGLLERGTSEREADLRARVAAIKAKEAAKPGSALEEVAALGREFRTRLGQVRDTGFTPGASGEPTGRYSARQATKRAEMAMERPSSGPPSGYEPVAPATRLPFVESAFARAEARRRGVSPEQAKAEEEKKRREFETLEAEARQGAAPTTPATPGGLSAFRRYQQAAVKR